MVDDSLLGPIEVDASEAIPGDALTREYLWSSGLIMKSASGNVLMLGSKVGSETPEKGASIMNSDSALDTASPLENSGSGVSSSIFRKGVAGPGVADREIVLFLPAI
jgi:hypothetical protein